MIPLQEIVIRTDKSIFYHVHIEAPTGATHFKAEVFIYSLESYPRPIDGHRFPQQFNDANEAFTLSLKWVMGYSKKYDYIIESINNPCNCEFLSKDAQQVTVNEVGLKLPVLVNGK